jgi:hypothetical protein
VKLEYFKTIINVKPVVDVLKQVDDNGGDEANGGCRPL